jgi:hypothetical protein
MGLDEKRRTKEIQDETIPKFKTEFKQVTDGGTINVEVDWATFTTMDALGMLPSAVLGYFMTAVKDCCRDAVGKEAVRDGLKTLTIKNQPEKTGKIAQLENGTFRFEACFGEGQYFTDTDLKDAISAGL